MARLIDVGVDLIRSGKLQKAVEYFEKQLMEYEDNDGLWRFLGKARSELNQKENAVTAIEKSILINPDQPMWLYKLLVENKFAFEYFKNTKFLNDEIRSLLSDEVLISSKLGLDDITYPKEIFSGDGLIGKKIMFKAIKDKNISFISPFSGEVVSTDKSITEYTYYFDEGFYLTFYSDWSQPFSSFQYFIPEKNMVIFGCLDFSPKIPQDSTSHESTLMYFAKLMRVLSKYKYLLEEYKHFQGNKKIVVKNQNFRHLGHAIWNGLSSLSPFFNNPDWRSNVNEFIVEASVLGDDLLSTYTEKIPTIKPKEELEPFIYNGNVFLVTLKDNFVDNRISRCIVKDAIAAGGYNTQKAEFFRKKHFPIVLLGVRIGTREWLNQKSTYEEIIYKVSSIYPSAGFVIDGMNHISSEVHSSHANIDLDSEVAMADQLKEGRGNVVSLVGSRLQENIPWIEVSDLCIAPWGAGLAKYKWLCNKKTFVVASRCVLEEKSDLHIYDSTDYMEYAVKDSWLKPQSSFNHIYPDFEFYKSISKPKLGYHYQSYSCDKESIVKMVMHELDLIFIDPNVSIHNSLKHFC